MTAHCHSSNISLTFRYLSKFLAVLERIVAESDNEELKRMASGALWVLRGNSNQGSQTQRNQQQGGQNDILTSLTIQKEDDDQEKGF